MRFKIFIYYSYSHQTIKCKTNQLLSPSNLPHLPLPLTHLYLLLLSKSWILLSLSALSTKCTTFIHLASKTYIFNKDSYSLKYTSNNSTTLSKTSILKLIHKETKSTFEKIIQEIKHKRPLSTEVGSQKGWSSTTARVNCCWSGWWWSAMDSNTSTTSASNTDSSKIHKKWSIFWPTISKTSTADLY